MLEHESARYRVVLNGLIHMGKAAGTLADVCLALFFATLHVLPRPNSSPGHGIC